MALALVTVVFVIALAVAGVTLRSMLADRRNALSRIARATRPEAGRSITYAPSRFVNRPGSN